MMQITDGEGKQKNRRILCGRKDSSMQSENLSGNTNQAVFKHSFLCMHLDFPLFPNSPCTDLQPGENRQHHILWLISPCHGKCSTPSEACQEFWTQPAPGMPTVLRFRHFDQKKLSMWWEDSEGIIYPITNKRASGVRMRVCLCKRNAPERCV